MGQLLARMGSRTVDKNEKKKDTSVLEKSWQPIVTNPLRHAIVRLE